VLIKDASSVYWVETSEIHLEEGLDLLFHNRMLVVVPLQPTETVNDIMAALKTRLSRLNIDCVLDQSKYTILMRMVGKQWVIVSEVSACLLNPIPASACKSGIENKVSVPYGDEITCFGGME